MKRVIITAYLLVSCFIIMITLSISAAEKGLWIRSIDASSVLEPEKDTYNEGNLLDLTDDSWCEGKKDAGIGESVTIRLASPAAVRTLYIKNGMGVAKYRAANNRVREMKINGAAVTLRDDPGFQAVRLQGKATDTLTLTIVSVYKGDKWNDTCLAEIAFDNPGDSFNRPDNYAKIAGKMWDTGGLMPGNATVFSKGFLFSSMSVPCGDETCPNETVGSCRARGRNQYECRFIEHCQGTYDRKLNRAGRTCTPESDTFILDLAGGSPVVTVKGKKTKLAPFD